MNLFFFSSQLHSQKNEGKIFCSFFSCGFLHYICFFDMFLIYYVLNNCMDVVVEIVFHMRTIFLDFSWIFFNFVVKFQLNVYD
jgi:hypothetical protein